MTTSTTTATAPATTAKPAAKAKPPEAKRQPIAPVADATPPTLHVVDPAAADARTLLLDIEREMGATFAERDREIRAAADARTLLLDIEREMGATFAERDREIRGLIIALVAGEHVLLLGPAGTGKSALAHTLCNAIQGGSYFQWLMTRFSAPEELFGPVSLDGLKHDKFRRATAGKMPESTVTFLDECFKANSAILNALLTVLNERAFDNDGVRNPIPLEMCVGASNELPEGPELGALFDRFLLRYWTAYTRTPDAFTRLLLGDEPSITATITLDEIHIAQEDAAKVGLPQATVDELFKLRAELIGQGVIVSDRRWRKAAKILRAVAWLDGASEVTSDVFPVLANVLWDTPDQYTKLVSLVSKYTSAELSEAQECFDSVVALVAELPKEDAPEFGTKVAGVTREMKRAAEKIGALKQGTKPAIAAKIDIIAKDLDRRYKTLRESASRALGL